MKILCVIGARGGSKGVANKNIRPLLGKPLIAWTIEQALACPEIEKLVVSTDSPDIARVAKEYGAEVPFMRPAHLADDHAGKWEVWQHALEASEAYYKEKVEIFVDLDCTAPLRDVSDISKAIHQFQQNTNVDGIFSINKAKKNPYFNMVEYGSDGYLHLSKTPAKPVVRRQDCPKVFEHAASIYVLSSNYVRTGTGLLSGKTQGYEMDPRAVIDIDDEIDYEIVEILMQKKLRQMKQL